jgi:hypothetical protein
MRSTLADHLADIFFGYHQLDYAGVLALNFGDTHLIRLVDHGLDHYLYEFFHGFVPSQGGSLASPHQHISNQCINYNKLSINSYLANGSAVEPWRKHRATLACYFIMKRFIMSR